MDVGLDGFSVHKFYKAGPEEYAGFGTIYGHISFTFMLISLLINASAAISCVLYDPKVPILRKIMLVPLHIIGSPFVSIFYLVKASQGLLNGTDTDGSAAERADKVKLIEALAESFPQATMKLYIIVVHDEVEWWMYLTLTISLLSLASTVSTSQYLFGNADLISRVVFFTFGFINATSRLVTCASVWPGVIMLSAAILIWIIKRFCSCCLCCQYKYHPLSPDHSRVHNIVLNWILMVVYNCFTRTGLVISTINVICSLLLIIYNLLKDEGSDLYTKLNDEGNDEGSDLYNRFIINTTVGLVLSLLTFFANLVLVLVPKFSHRIENSWLNISEQNYTKLY